MDSTRQTMLSLKWTFNFVLVLTVSIWLLLSSCLPSTLAWSATTRTSLITTRGQQQSSPPPLFFLESRRSSSVTMLFSSSSPSGNKNDNDDVVDVVVSQSTPTTGAVKERSATDPVAAAVETTTTTTVTTSSSQPEEEGNPYPVDLPSPLLLGGSILLAISSTGSFFQLVLGNGGASTSTSVSAQPLAIGLAVIGFPIALFLFYAAILKAQAETELDDAEFMRGRK